MAAPYDGGGGGGAGGMGGGGSNSNNNLPRTISVKNKAPAPRQITAEQILREAQEIKLEDDFRPPASVIADPQELAEYRAAKRQAFEDQLRRVGRWSPAAWAKYAAWEEAQRDFRRARSVMERALEVDYRHVATWIKYAEMEMRHRFVAHARNVWDRAVTLLPRVDALWYRYAHMEEVLGNADGVRQVFERWMRFEPDHAAWMAYVNVSFSFFSGGVGCLSFSLSARRARSLPAITTQQQPNSSSSAKKTPTARAPSLSATSKSCPRCAHGCATPSLRCRGRGQRRRGAFTSARPRRWAPRPTRSSF